MRTSTELSDVTITDLPYTVRHSRSIETIYLWQELQWSTSGAPKPSPVRRGYQKVKLSTADVVRLTVIIYDDHLVTDDKQICWSSCKDSQTCEDGKDRARMSAGVMTTVSHGIKSSILPLISSTGFCRLPDGATPSNLSRTLSCD